MLTTAEILDMSDKDVAAALFAEWQPGEKTLNLGPLGHLMPLKGGPERYGEICRIMAANAPRGHVAIEADLLLGAVYGVRNGGGKWDEKTVFDLLERVRELILPLPDATRLPLERRRLYHLGLVHREVWSDGHFLTAASIHEEAARIAPTEAKRQMELAIAEVERLHHAVEIYDLGLFPEQMAALDRAEDALRPFADEDPEVKKWLEADIPCHRMYCAWLMGLNYPKLDADYAALDRVNDPNHPLHKSYKVWYTIFLAVKGPMTGRTDTMQIGLYPVY